MGIRQLVDRWRFGAGLPEEWEGARRSLNQKLRELERILSILHGAVEYPAVSYPTRIVYTADTTINTGSYVDFTSPVGSTTVTVDVDSTLWIELFFYVQCTTFGAASDIFTGTLAISGAPFGSAATIGFTAVNDSRMVSRVVQNSVKSGTSLSFKLQGKMTGTSAYKALAGCAIHCLVIPNQYMVP